MNPSIVIALLVVLPVCIGITCYRCTGCNDPFDENAHSSDKTTGHALCYKGKSNGIVNRDGSSLVLPCDASTFGVDSLHCCTTELCNGSSSNFKTPILLFFGLIALFAKYRLV